MKRVERFILFGVLIALQCQLFAQDAFIYGKQGEKMYFREDTNSIVIGFKSLEYMNDSAGVICAIKGIDKMAQYEILTPQMIKFRTKIPFDTILEIMSDYDNKMCISRVYCPVSNNHTFWCNNRIVIMSPSEELLHTILSQLSVEYENLTIFNENGFYILTLSGIEDKSIQVSNMLYETGLVVSAQPDFYITADLCNPNYGDQWGLHNTGQYGFAYNGIDIKAPEAWDITQGSSNVKVAVIDCGIDLTHPSLQYNLQQGCDLTNVNGDGSCILDYENGHGTACAGIIAAKDNNVSVVGVASNSKIIPIPLSFGICTPEG